ncbi:MAG: molybdopterin-dependent oxidoreductase [Desulfobacterales bacterium]
MRSGRKAGAFPQKDPLSASTGSPAEAFALNPFVKIGADGRVTVISKHFESGQGIYTGLATLLAEELDADWESVQVESAPADERLYNNLFFGPMQATGGSTGIANSYEQYRRAGAAARAMLISAAEINVQNGVVFHEKSGNQATFGELASKAAGMTPPADVLLKDPQAFKLIGKQAARVDVEAKAQGSAQYALDVRLPNM